MRMSKDILEWLDTNNRVQNVKQVSQNWQRGQIS